MAGFNFADHYRAAGLTPGPEILRLRQDPFDKLRKAVTPRTAVTWTRLYFGLPGSEGVEAFRETFAAPDPSFSMVDNAREVAVLAGCLLGGALADGKIYAGLAPLCAAAAGNRVPLTSPEMIDEFAHGIAESAIKQRQRERANLGQIRHPAVSKVPAEAQSIVANNDWAKVAALFKQVSDEATEATKNLANQTAGVARPLALDVEDLREEIAMLWWYIGGWNRSLDVPYVDLAPAAVPLLAGLDLADLSSSLAGPVAAPALLKRLIASAKKGKAAKVTIATSIGALDANDLEKVGLADSSSIQVAPDICPLHHGLAKAKEAGGGEGWHAAFEKTSGLSAKTEFSLTDLGIQAYREGLFLTALE